MADLISESQTTVVNAIVELIEIDFTTRLSSSGSGVDQLYFTNETQDIVFDGDTYSATSLLLTIPAVGLDLSPAKGTLSIFGQNSDMLTAINGYNNQIRGSVLRFKQTHERFLDGEVDADPTQVFEERYIVESIKERSKERIELELSVGLSLERINVPAITEVRD